MSKPPTNLDLHQGIQKHRVVFSTQNLIDVFSQTWLTLKSGKILILSRILTMLDDSDMHNAILSKFHQRTYP